MPMRRVTIENGKLESSDALRRSQRLFNFLYFQAYPLLLFANLCVTPLIALRVDMTPVLHTRYAHIFPMNADYISSLESLGIDTRQIGSIILTNSNAAMISYVFAICLFIVNGIFLPIMEIRRNIPGLYIGFKSISVMILSLAILSLFIGTLHFIYPYERYSLSVQDIGFSLIKINFLVYTVTFCSATAAIALIGDIFRMILRREWRFKW